jgi:aromatic-L-amino-acid decarboxylase
VTAPKSPLTFDLDETTLRQLGAAAVDIWTELVARIQAGPVTTDHTPAEVRARVAGPLPDEGSPPDALLDDLRDLLLNYSTFNGNPRFFAYVTSSPTLIGALADFLGAAANTNVGAWRLSPGTTEVELQVLDWIKEIVGYPADAAGVLTSGGAMANFVALAVARDAAADWDVRREGLAGHPPLRLYTTAETHSVLSRGADLLGLGTANVVEVAMDADLRMDPAALARAIEADLRAGYKPMAAVGSAGTVGTGVVDPLVEIAAVCRQHRLWFHVDGAYGAFAILAPSAAERLQGMALADSIALDPHKWLYAPLEAGCVLVRKAAHLHEAFAVHAAYTYEDKGRLGERHDFYEHSPYFSRGSKALKVWLAFRQYGRAGYAARIERDIALAHYAQAQLEARADFEVVAPAELSIVCFRYVPESLRGPRTDADERYLDDLNQRIMEAVQQDGRVYCSNASVKGRTALRACIVNYRTQESDVDMLIEVCSEIGQRLAGEDAG